MIQKQALRQMTAFNKTVFDHTYEAMALLQEQTERMMTISLEQAKALPQEGKKALAEWLKACRKGGEIFKKSVDDGFQKLESFWA